MRNSYFRWGTLLIVLLALAVSIPEGMAGADGSGLEGTVAVTPAHPGPIHKGEIAQAPAGHLTFAVYRGEEKVASFTTDAAGQFRVALPPGHYVVRREGAGAAIGRWQFEAEVASGKMTKVTWTGDSGMR